MDFKIKTENLHLSRVSLRKYTPQHCVCMQHYGVERPLNPLLDLCKSLTSCKMITVVLVYFHEVYLMGQVLCGVSKMNIIAIKTDN